jgi:hypothetical protein
MASELEREFLDFHRENPRVYVLVCQFAQQAIDLGFEKYAIATIWEVLRWEVQTKTRDRDFKLPNNHRAYYARLWLKNHPEHPDFFRTCSLRSVEHGQRDRYGRDVDDAVSLEIRPLFGKPKGIIPLDGDE